MIGVTGFTPIGNYNSEFTGHFDGDGHTITGLTVDRGSSNYVGLFGHINGGSVDNLTLDGASITGYNNVGGIAGYSYGGSITNSHVVSCVITAPNSSSVGAFVGNSYSCTLDGNTYHSTLVYGKTDYGDFHADGDAFNIATKDYYELDAKLFLSDGRDNTALIAAYADPEHHAKQNYYPQFNNLSVTLQGRTLYKDGDWNTLCLPFAVSSFTGTPLEGATVKELLTTSNLDADGKLTLNFSSNNLTAIEAGKPYIVKWETPGEDIVHPVFTGVTTINATAPTAVEFTGGKFVGQYDPFSIVASGASGTNEGNLNEIILLGTGNTLGYSSEPRTLHPFRAHFEVPVGDGGNSVKAYQISFGEGDETGIISIDNGQLTMDNEDGAWYSLDGRKLPGKPAQKGIYIHDGKKVVLP